MLGELGGLSEAIVDNSHQRDIIDRVDALWSAASGEVAVLHPRLLPEFEAGDRPRPPRRRAPPSRRRRQGLPQPHRPRRRPPHHPAHHPPAHRNLISTSKSCSSHDSRQNRVPADRDAVVLCAGASHVQPRWLPPARARARADPRAERDVRDRPRSGRRAGRRAHDGRRQRRRLHGQRRRGVGRSRRADHALGSGVQRAQARRCGLPGVPRRAGDPPPAQAGVGDRRGHRRRASSGGFFAEGFVVGISNPKTIVFLAAILPQFVAPMRPRPACRCWCSGACSP